MKVYSCAYLHNYIEKKPEPLKANIYSAIIRDSPIYFKNDQEQLEEFIRVYTGKGKGGEILYEIENGNIRPSKKLIDHVTGLFEGNAEFNLLEEQKVAYETAMDIALNSIGKNVVIIKGGPGTGKSVISMNLLGGLLKADKNVIFVAPNASFREVMIDKLTKKYDKRRIRHLLKGSGAFYGARKDTFDVLVIDEAHRLKNENAFMYKGENQIEDIINAARVSIFFIDEKQLIRPDDIGTIKEITRIAGLHNAKVHSLALTAQFRCSGAEGYINWVDDVLQLAETANFDGWDKEDFEFKIYEDPRALLDAIKAKSDKGLNARVLAGYAWKWSTVEEGNPDSEIKDVSIPEYGFAMPWNSRNVGTTWAIVEDGVNQIGCVHTSQGLEFDYVGVIIGNDLRINSSKGQYFTAWNEYKDSKGKQGMKNKAGELNKLVRNIYRILLTRGMKGCYVYCVDKDLQTYLKERIKPI